MKIRHCLKCRDNGGQVHNIVITHMHVKNLYIKQRKIRKFGFFLGRAWKIYHTLLLVALCMNGIECEEGKVTKKIRKKFVWEKKCVWIKSSCLFSFCSRDFPSIEKLTWRKIHGCFYTLTREFSHHFFGQIIIH